MTFATPVVVVGWVGGHHDNLEPDRRKRCNGRNGQLQTHVDHLRISSVASSATLAMTNRLAYRYGNPFQHANWCLWWLEVIDTSAAGHTKLLH